MFKWRLQVSTACDSGNDRQTINHIIKEYQRRKSNQGICWNIDLDKWEGTSSWLVSIVDVKGYHFCFVSYKRFMSIRKRHY
ncbi:Uncharacterized protein FWK35_00012358 [Aphis craccivora]|uniref:Uncharacterized protein n=1 Tax=Aphis craccivora TaxID=307492 RepID=A0A6G0YFJ3_APHCR|nr:Uncharacterized protein FWK35_00012358 [Aphis craccivora]